MQHAFHIFKHTMQGETNMMKAPLELLVVIIGLVIMDCVLILLGLFSLRKLNARVVYLETFIREFTLENGVVSA